MPYASTDRAVFRDSLVTISRETGCSVHLSEISELGGTEEDVAKAYSEVIAAAIESGVVKSANFWSTLSFVVPAPDSPWQNNLILPEFKQGIVYRAVWNTLSKYASAK